MLLTHIACGVSNLFSLKTERWYEYASVCVMLATAMQVLNITWICNFVYTESSTGVEMSPEFESFNYWLSIELVVFVAVLLGNCTYLFISSLIRPKGIADLNSVEFYSKDFLES